MTLTIELLEDQQAAKAQERGISAEEYARQVLAQDLEAGMKPRLPIWERIAERMKNVPPGDLAALPTDGASQIDHYVYGVPKRPL